jgi:hypothetical protein
MDSNFALNVEVNLTGEKIFNTHFEYSLDTKSEGGKVVKKFHISDILTVISGKMVSIRNMEGLYDILNYMSKDNLHTHQLVRVMDECKPYLIKQFPEFEEIKINFANVNDSNLLSLMEIIEEELGSYFEVDRLPEGVHEYINPVAEMIMMQNE